MYTIEGGSRGRGGGLASERGLNAIKRGEGIACLEFDDVRV